MQKTPDALTVIAERAWVAGAIDASGGYTRHEGTGTVEIWVESRLIDIAVRVAAMLDAPVVKGSKRMTYRVTVSGQKAEDIVHKLRPYLLAGYRICPPYLAFDLAPNKGVSRHVIELPIRLRGV